MVSEGSWRMTGHRRKESEKERRDGEKHRVARKRTRSWANTGNYAPAENSGEQCSVT